MLEDKNRRTERGRVQFIFEEGDGRASVLIENTTRDKGFWLPVREFYAPNAERIIGHLRFRKLGLHLFELSEMRPANAPLLDEEIEMSQHEEKKTRPDIGRVDESAVVTADWMMKNLPPVGGFSCQCQGGSHTSGTDGQKLGSHTHSLVVP